MSLKCCDRVRVDMVSGQEGSENTGPSTHGINAKREVRSRLEVAEGGRRGS